MDDKTLILIGVAVAAFLIGQRFAKQATQQQQAAQAAQAAAINPMEWLTSSNWSL